MIFIAGLLGWALAGRAIRPLNLVAHAAQEITGSNLSLRIPRRNANDELDNLIDSFNRMTGRLSESFDQIRQFSTDVSHELRTPLTAIRGQLEVALFTAEKPDQFRDAMVNALEDVEKLSSIVRALLLLSQAESGQLVLQKAPPRSGRGDGRCGRSVPDPGREKDVKLTATLEPGWMAQADRTQVERMISNLLSNAMKYTPRAASVHVSVRRDAKRDGSGWRWRITAWASRPRICRTFSTAFIACAMRRPTTRKGLGLGLSFVAWIVSAHDGVIHVESDPGNGSKFIVRLPAAMAAQEIAPEPVPTAV